MKNIHLLPTEKPSRLFNCFGKLEIGDYVTTRENLQVTNQHIYITSDELIKEGEYGLSKLNEIIKFHSGYDYRYYAKIILTTDQDLIKDGVQAIDDEFLEWFVKNPSCEEVKIKRDFADEGIKGITYYGKYFLIIPKEEPKQETLEEAAEKYAERKSSNPTFRNTHIRDFKAGADWQSERMYSEEEVYELLSKFHIVTDGTLKFQKEWFEQFKKK
jgi:hypothetical protein